MKTIEERAFVYAPGNTDLQNQCRLAYIKGAEHQHNIDISKALVFLKEYGPDSFSCWEEFEYMFRRAIKE